MVKVLIVDDEKLERILIRNGFAWEENGFEIIGEASSGTEALEMIQQKQPDIVLTDINMPNMTGIKLVEHIREMGIECRIVIITGYREFDYARQAVRLGVEDFLLKPLDIEEIEHVVLEIRDKVRKEHGKTQMLPNHQNNMIKESGQIQKNGQDIYQDVDQDMNSDVVVEEQGMQDEISIDWKDFIYAVQNCMLDKAKGYVQEYIDRIRLTERLKPEYLRLLTMNMISKAEVTLNRYGKNHKDVPGGEKLYMEIGGITTPDGMQEFLMRAVEQLVEFHREIGGKKRSEMIEQAVEYVEKNLTDPELSLKIVAAAVYANESYLSRVFKKELGESLIEYITRARIAESIRLLNTTNLKVYEIAERVGFRDSHYFSICFKKQVGVTIKEFKNSGK